MASITPYITRAGLAAIWNETQDGFAAKITHVGVGVTQFTQAEIDAIAGRTTLKDEVARWAVTDAEQVSPSQIYLYVEGVSEGINNPSNCDADGGFWVNNIGFFFEDGTLFAIYPVLQGNAPEGYKSPNSILDLDYQLALEAVPAGSVTVVNTGIRFNPGLTDAYAGLAADMLQAMQHDYNQDAQIAEIDQRLTANTKQLGDQIVRNAKQAANDLEAQSRELLLLLAWKQATDAMYIRARGWSGLMAVRQYTNHGGQDNLRSVNSSEKNTPGHVHQHPEWGDLLGTGEIWAVVNGWQFKARHRDHHLVTPAPAGSSFLQTVKLEPPALPPEITGTVEQQTAAMIDLFSRYQAGEWPAGFRADLTALEVWIEPYASTLSDTYHSDRHALQTSSLTDALRLLLHYSASGLKDRFENQSVEMPLVAWVDASGEPQLGILRYRMICTSLESLGDVRPMLETHEDVMFNVGWGRDSGRFHVIEGSNAPGALDQMMGLLPGLDGAGANLTENHTRYGQTESIRTWSDNARPLNAAYYNRFAQALGDDAANRHHFIRSDYDPYLFVASNTRAEVLDMAFAGNPHRWSYAIPMEVVIRTPLESWNPYAVPAYTGTTRKGYADGYGKASTNPIPGERAEFGMYFKTPADLFAGASSADEADTATGEYWVTCGDGAARKMRASGIWINTPPIQSVGSIRLRYPIHPEHQEGDKAHTTAVATHRETTGNMAALMADMLRHQLNEATP